MAHCSSLFSLIFVTIVLAASISSEKDVTIASFNLHGFSTSSQYAKDCISSYKGIWMLQEHWLSEFHLSKLQQLNCQYVAHSGMEDSVSSGIYRGRPYGGVAICWSPDLNHLIRPVSNYKHKRVVAVELNSSDRIILFIYMPFYNASKQDQCMNDTIDAISMIELLIEDHPHHEIVIGGDLNTELKGESPFDPLWSDLLTKYSFAYCDSFISAPRYTYRHDTLDQKKFNDHFIVSKSFLDGSSHNHRILDDGDNCSDHLPILMNIRLQIQPPNTVQNQTDSQSSVNWAKLSNNTVSDYTRRLEQNLLQRQTPLGVSLCRRPCGCTSDACRQDIQDEYNDIISCVKDASKSLPKKTVGVEKDWWTPALTQLRNQNISVQSMWIAEGRPRQGPICLERLRVRATYKNEIRRAKRAPKQSAWNKLHSAMSNEDTQSFWKWWRSVYGKDKNNFAPVVDGQTTSDGIASAFQSNFQKNSEPNNSEKVRALDSEFQLQYAKFSHGHSANCDCESYSISLNDTIDAICAMNQGKCSDDDGLQAEHFMNGPLALMLRLTSLFNYMLKHAFVPEQFRFGTIVPIIKDRNGNSSDISNYRGITISPMASKIFEIILRNKFANSLKTSLYQFGFKRKLSTNHALYCLRETINYYVDHGSRVYCSFLDASKAFDRVVHSGLFIKLNEISLNAS